MLALKEKVLEVGTEPREAVLFVLGVEGGRREDWEFQISLVNKVRHCLKTTKPKRASEVAHWSRCFPPRLATSFFSKTHVVEGED